MKLQYASDLHLEMATNMKFIKANPLLPKADILLLAGDITHLEDSSFKDEVFDLWSSEFKQVYMIPGNHEFYDKCFPISGTLPTFEKKVRENVIYLNNKTIIIGDVRIIFTTLFSNIPPNKKFEIRHSIADFYRSIYSGVTKQILTIDEFHEAHQICLDFLEGELKTDSKGKTIVVSHFVPFHKNKLKDYPWFPMDLSSYFHVELEWLCEAYKIDHWISGHTHIPFKSFQLENTWMHQNMLGYVSHYEHKQFRADAILEL
ncbi:MAG: metallophosphoesterase [Cyclobacteriaceae bacterium]